MGIFPSQIYRDKLNYSIPEGYIAWCSGQEPNDNICNFKNLCFSHHSKRFFVINNTNVQETIVISLSTAQPDLFTYTTVHDLNFKFRDKILINYKEGKYLLFRRFIPGNIAHAIHDELMPLFYTLLRHGDITDDVPQRTLVSFRSLWLEEAYGLYNLFSKDTQLLETDLQLEPDDSFTCFEDITVGLTKESLWYQIGFNEPEGPLVDSKVTATHIRNFTAYIRRRLIIPSTCPSEEYGVVFSRLRTRRLLNEKELASKIEKEFQLNMVFLHLEVNKMSHISDVIKVVSCARLITGMHGAAFILSMFLQPGSVVMELYPYALNPEYLTYYKTLLHLPDMNIEYLTWRNLNQSNTVTRGFNWLHPLSNRIVNVPRDEQLRIINSAEVPPHLCCYNTEFQFRMRQDTYVNITNIINILARSSLRYKKYSHTE
ncbi:Protein O-linked-mannose beta-1,4-N-acetylglucosaminyltransferase 2 [Apostichopus japonicus]|uniref:Protein O-linked-mannose beta-1,4-N-acetylglucosaminyltransferase 2 n=1 Tax=Stichopus japonicus TaxID=307972 RepID=A0A2G8K098_STIJA|nr:Protein O-linked-mannose beta-1,4-N-acetylglucosaminyltransferase 2 [Apostichopus japonicus]